ncbi:MAG: hypothetical protein JWO20_2226 [Candidatus Angelobacter sp.]|nr:hypothetical protein [Candidatus Angelobacter sp.]
MPLAAQPHSTATPLKTTDSRKYFKLQLKAWTTFDPAQYELAAIADAIQRGGGFVTVMEVTQVSELKEISDLEVRERFESLEAAEKILQNLDKLPKSVREQLYSALATEKSNTSAAEPTSPRAPEYKAA